MMESIIKEIKELDYARNEILEKTYFSFCLRRLSFIYEEGIIYQWNNGMIIYGTGRFDDWQVSIIYNNDSICSPRWVDIEAIKNLFYFKMGKDKFNEFCNIIENLKGDPRTYNTKLQLLNVVNQNQYKDEEPNFCYLPRRITIIDGHNLYNKWDLTIERFCFLWYSIIYADRMDDRIRCNKIKKLVSIYNCEYEDCPECSKCRDHR